MDILAKNLLILASAGSGKTFQLGNRVIGLVARGAEPERIVALTFTRKAAGEFADSVLTKLAEAASEKDAATDLRVALATPDADFKNALEKVVRALPRITLGTMDGFFAKIVRGFQYELGLTGGKFDLLEGPRASALTDDMLTGILGDVLAREDGEEFFHAFRRATIGREDQTVSKALRDFINRWHGRYRESPELDWGPARMAKVPPDEWTKQKSALAATILRGLDDIEYTRKGQREALEKEITNLENHVIGGGSLGGKISSLMASILDAVAKQTGPLHVKSYKEFTIGGASGDALRTMIHLAAQCEFASALSRTRAVREVVSVFDHLCATRLRRKGLLGFNDVKLLMGEWARGEDPRLRREAVDFRLDSRIDHWLLDEFQDTSRSDWTGLLPLIDEAASDDDGSMFIVGDRKQAIYAWRGGDVSLFDEVITRYGSGLEIAPMAESWRSCPEVLTLVNQVCGDVSTLHELFGVAATRWDWQDHFPATPLATPDKRGQARVEMVGDWDQRVERLAEILHDLGVGTRAMTCGVLLRGNEKARQVADELRARGFDVIEEGRRLPGQDNPIGVFITNLLKWVADPADAFARGVLEMSPLAGQLQSSYGSLWDAVWTGLTADISRSGFASTIETLVTTCWADWSEFGHRRAGDLLAGLASLDHQGGVSAKEAADWMERLELSQSPGVAAVQVMTIHKSKGLGFDVVILPEIPDEGIPQAQFFDVAESDDWLTQTPPKWSRELIPELREAETRWNADQRYEAFCMLYVALTRAKRGLYVLLDLPSKSSDPEKPSLSNWLIRSVGGTTENEVLHQTGTDGWTNTIPMSEPDQTTDDDLTLVCAKPRRTRESPSGNKSQHHATAHSPAGMQFGNDVHSLFETVGWIDETSPSFPRNEVGRAVERVTQSPSLREIFERTGRNIDLFHEQATDLVQNDKLVSGIIDRLHLHRNAQNHVTQVEIIDYKTDAVKDPSELLERYSDQMNAYRNAMQIIYPNAEIICALLSVRHAQLLVV